MALTSGFFNSINGDRTYNADQMSTYFKGLIGSGVYENVGGGLQVTAGTGLTLRVQSGRAIVGESMKWLNNDAVYEVTLNAAHVTLNRYSAIVIQMDTSTRNIDIVAIDGANATNPIKPNINETSGVYELCLAYVYVAAGATTITQSSIQDTRSDNTVCGWITGLVDQVDTSTLFDQWEAAYNENIADMESWEATQKAAFESWLSTLTSQLTVGAYIRQYQKVVEIGANDSKIIPLDMTGYTYESTDIFTIILNGLVATEAYDYLIDTSTTPPEVHVNLVNATDELVDIRVIKSILGVSS